MLAFTRKPWSFFAPDFTYAVHKDGVWVGEVARLAGERRWHASNITWTGGREFEETYPTRKEAALALLGEES